MEKISFTRGDTYSYKFRYKNINKDDIDTLFLTCRQEPNEKSPILFEKEKKDFVIDDEYIHGEFATSDTENLDYGVYHFDIEMTLKNGYRKTKIGQFEITRECTFHKEDE